MDYSVTDGTISKSGNIQDSTTFNGTFNAGANKLILSGFTGTSLTITGNANASGSRSAINGIEIVEGTPLTINSFTSDNRYVPQGTTVRLSWDVDNETSLSINQGIGDVTGLNFVDVVINATNTFTLTATNSFGTETSNLVVYEGNPKPNIVIFLVDDMGVNDTSVPFVYDTNGTPISNEFNQLHQTPNMEALAAKGIKFTQAYATPVCSSTRASLLTGHNTLRHGVISQVTSAGNYDPVRQNPATNSHSAPNNWKRTGMQADDITLPMLLGSVGYRSIHAGKAHFGSNVSYAKFPDAIGFDINIAGDQSGSSSYTNFSGKPNMSQYSGTNTFLTDALTTETDAAMESAVNDATPFLLYFSHYALHSPFTTDPNATGDYSAAHNNNHQKFSTMIEGMDLSLGQTIAKLEALGIAEETLIIFLGDNGSDSPASTNNGLASGIYSDFPQRGKKATAWEGGIHVPFIVSWAKSNPTNPIQASYPITPNSIETDLVTVWDVLPTVLKISDTPTTQEFDGYDLTPYLTGQAGEHRPQEFLMYLPIDHRNDYFAIYREGDMKLHYYFADNSFQLYDIPNDLTESTDLAPTNPEIVLQMARKMAQAFQDGWGIHGELWPTLNPTDGSSRPYPNDVFFIDYTTDGKDTVDSDGDGLFDHQEDTDSNGLISPGESNVDLADTDSDGTSDFTESQLGLDPTDRTKSFTLIITDSAPASFTLTWPSQPGLTFSLMTSTTLQGPIINWTAEQTSIPSSSTGNNTTLTFPKPTEDKKFYSIKLE